MKYDHFTMLPERAFQPRNGRSGMTLEGGGGGPTQSTVTQSNIPEWLQPQTEALLGAATQEYFETTERDAPKFRTETRTDADGNTQEVQVPDGSQKMYDITGIKPFTPYSTDPSKYVAGFTPEQEAGFREAAGMQRPGQFFDATQLSGVAGMGGIESARSAAGYGALGTEYGMEAAGLGGLYERMATSPDALKAYMSPYTQNVTEIAKAQAIEDAKRAQLGANLGAVRQGTYGGARQALAQSQREAGLTKQLSDIQTRGLESAYDRAIQSQQFGVGTELQGLQAAMQGSQIGLQGVGAAQAGFGLAGQQGQALANIGQGQQASDLSRMQFQQELAGLPQAQQQRILDQSIQNYALSQEAPFQRLSGYSGLIRGYATPTTTVESYSAPASPVSQLAGLGAAYYGATAGKRAGGKIEEGIDTALLRKNRKSRERKSA
jgi:hypothetical protein